MLLDLSGECRQFIEDYVDQKGYGPSLREVGDSIGVSVTSVMDLFKDLHEREEITYGTHQGTGYMMARSVRIVKVEDDDGII